jgi:hypothetical protein
MKETDSFIEIRNDDSILLNLKSGWISSYNIFGDSFSNVLKGSVESGIYAVWKARYNRFLHLASIKQVKNAVKVKRRLQIGDDEMKDRSLSWSQLRNCFAILEWGISFSITSYIAEIVWFKIILRCFNM